MLARISERIELSSWQIAVRLLSIARPLSRGIQKAQQATEKHYSIVENGWTLAIAGWTFGLILGILISAWV